MINISKLRKIHLIKRNISWWKSEASFLDKSLYYPSAVVSVFRLLITKQKSINYLGENFLFDNPTTPLSIMYYPYEITKKILKNTKYDIKNVLDIGGNIGQFSITLSSLSKKNINIDVFEPNPTIFSTLKKNVKNHKNIKAYNFALGDTKITNLFYEPDRSSIASFVEANSGDESTRKKVQVKTSNNVSKITGKSTYDLIKIDVEGYEFDLLKNIAAVDTRYIFIEISGLGRQKSYGHMDLFCLIREKFGDFDIVYSSSSNRLSDQFDMLLEKRS